MPASSLDLAADPVELAAALVDIPSISGAEREIADAVEAGLRKLAGFTVDRDGNAVVARSQVGCATRVILAGHLDTVPITDNVPSRFAGPLLHGCGSSDMKSGDAVMLHLADQMARRIADGRVDELWCDATFVFYDNEEVEFARSGLGRLARDHPDWIRGDFAVLLEPTNGAVEAGCQGTLRAAIRVQGRRAHSARSWLGSNAVHAAGSVLTRLSDYQPRQVEIDGCVFREGLNAVAITGGVASNIIPDECVVMVNYRFAPDRDEAAAAAHVQNVFDGFELEIVDSAPGALPLLRSPGMERFLAAVGRPVAAKYGWTDVARFSALGVPAINFGPGDPALAHTKEEYVAVQSIAATATALRSFLFTWP